MSAPPSPSTNKRAKSTAQSVRREAIKAKPNEPKHRFLREQVADLTPENLAKSHHPVIQQSDKYIGVLTARRPIAGSTGRQSGKSFGGKEVKHGKGLDSCCSRLPVTAVDRRDLIDGMVANQIGRLLFCFPWRWKHDTRPRWDMAGAVQRMGLFALSWQSLASGSSPGQLIER